MEIIDRKENPILNRVEITWQWRHTGAPTPTRKEIIDPAMIRAGWRVGEGPEFSAWSEFTITCRRASFSDYNVCDGRVHV